MALVWLDVALLFGGIVVLVVAADRMVLATAGLARRWGISPVVVGALIIGFGSSLPEMLVSVLALDQPNGLDLAVGNAIGSNIANISLVLAVSVLFFPISGQARVIRREGILMLVAMILAAAMLWDLHLSVPEALVLLAGLLVVSFAVIRWSAASKDEISQEVPDGRSTVRLAVEALVGLAALIAGARAMVLGAESIALELGLAEGVVGLTILALGTSLPELGTSLASARRGHNDLILGNVLGSNIFNALAVVGASGAFGPGALMTDFRPDLVMMVVVAVFAGLAAWSGDRLRRLEGALLLAAYPVAVALAL
jgi:cation:H+ antiporter